MEVFDKRDLEKLVKAKGNILNDNDSGVDYLGHSVYAEALSHKIEEVSTPITIGIFAKWGSGKSFLLNHVKNLLSRKQHQYGIDKKSSSNKCRSWIGRSFVRIIILLFLVALIIVSSLCAASPRIFALTPIEVGSINENSTVVANSTTTTTTEESSYDWTKLVRYFSLAILAFSLLFVCIVVCGNDHWWSSQVFANFRLISYAAFTKLPIKNIVSPILREDGGFIAKLSIDEKSTIPVETNKKFIFVNFNAWEYAGSDVMWAGIVTNLSNAIEAEFGLVTSRLFRMLNVNSIVRDVVKKETRLFVHFTQCSDEEKHVKEIMMEYGVVRSCVQYNKWKNMSGEIQDEDFSMVWVVEYSNPVETRNAQQALYLSGVKAGYDDPAMTYNGSSEEDFRKPSLKSDRFSGNLELKENYEMSVFAPENSINDKDVEGGIINEHTYQKPKGFFLHFLKHPKTTCSFPNLFWWTLIIIFIIAIPVVTYLVAEVISVDVFRTTRAVPVSVQILSWLPATTASTYILLKFVWAMLHSQRNRINSAIQGAKGTMSHQLGFMNKVKREVEYITELIKCAEFTHNKQYKVIIFIDDLDRVALDKVKSVLEAVSILLSDRSSPFVCLIAVDSRVAVKCIEENLGSALLGSGVSGHEYLKKIINLPFCLPEIDDWRKRQFVDGLIDLSDETRKRRVRRVDSGNNNQSDATNNRNPSVRHLHRSSTAPSSEPVTPSQNHQAVEVDSEDASTARTSVAGNRGERFMINCCQISGIVESNGGMASVAHTVPIDTRFVGLRGTFTEMGPEVTTQNNSPVMKVSVQKTLKNEAFLFECRKFLYESKMVQRHLHGNPRNIKRIFNVISLTSWLIHCYKEQHRRESFIRRNAFFKYRSAGTRQCCDGYKCEIKSIKRTKKLAEDLVIWVLLTDQWPYRMSYILQVMEDADQSSKIENDNKTIEDDASILDVYEKFIQPEIKTLQSENIENHMTSLDVHPDMFYCFLKELDQSPHNIIKRKVKVMKQITINLDYSLRQTIIRQRDVARNFSKKKTKEIEMFFDVIKQAKESFDLNENCNAL